MKPYILIVCLCLISASPVLAYIGPGAGFAFLTSFFTLFISVLLAFLIFITLPMRLLIRYLKRKKISKTAKANRVVILGLDGMEPTIVEKLMDAGKLPNFQKLKESGGYSHLGTTFPSLSPIAWSTFATGVNPGKHNIFDFITRDKNTYLPILSSSQVIGPQKGLTLGKYRIPLEKPVIRFLRKSKSFWKILSDYGIFSHVIRIPITFPPEKIYGGMLSAMCTPDLWGTQGTFSFFTTDRSFHPQMSDGEVFYLERKNGKCQGSIRGPENPIRKKGEAIPLDFTIQMKDSKEPKLFIDGETVSLKERTFTDWIELKFRAGFGIKIQGIVKFYLLETDPEIKLYMTPINIDPEKPALPISSPFYFSVYLAKLFGKYATLGLAEDTSAFNEKILDEKAFLDLTYQIHEEHEKHFFHLLNKTKNGLCAVVIDATDRIQHMFFRTLDPNHPANRTRENEKYQGVIEDLYIRMDKLVEETMQRLKQDDVLIILSDHGFKSFRRGINLNTWLRDQGYLVLKDGKQGHGEYFKDVDWSKTRAFAFGLGGIFINRKGREKQGIVSSGEELTKLKKELIQGLTRLKDPESGDIAIRKVYDNHDIFQGPYSQDGPDLIVGYHIGYRISWEGAKGMVTKQVFEDNIKDWSGDHCVDPELVPGVLFTNRKIQITNPTLKHIAPTVLNLFGIEKEDYMEGETIF